MTGISVVVPVFNGQAFISAALRSVLAQSRVPDEIIVVDDGSTDHSAEIAAEFADPVRLIRRPHHGGAAAINAGIAVARHQLLSFLDADDLWGPRKLERQCSVFDQDTTAEVVFGDVVEFSDPEYLVTSPEQISVAGRRYCGISKTAMLIRRSSFDRVGPFDPSIIVADFPEWYSRAQRLNLQTRIIDEVVAYRRIHNSNTTRLAKDALHRDYLRIARSAIRHRRKK